MSISQRHDPAAHTLDTPHSIIPDDQIEEADQRAIAAGSALANVADILTTRHREQLAGLAWLGYTVEVRQGADGAYLLYIPDALGCNVLTHDQRPAVWNGGYISLDDWLMCGERITAALLNAKEVR